MQQNVAIAEAIALSCFRPVDPARNRVVYERGNFPSVRYLYQAQPDLEVVVCEDDAEIVERIDERTLLVPISHVLFKDSRDPGRRADRAARARGRRARDPRLLPVGRDRPGRRHGARRRLRRRRLGEVAVRRARRTAGSTSGPTSPSDSSRPTPAGRRTSGRSRSRRRWSTRTAPPASSPGRRTRRRTMAGTAGYDLIEEIGVERIRENSLRQTELLIDARRRGRLRRVLDARSGAARRRGDRQRAGGGSRLRGARGARRSSATSARARGSASGRTSSRPTTSSGS